MSDSGFVEEARARRGRRPRMRPDGGGSRVPTVPPEPRATRARRRSRPRPASVVFLLLVGGLVGFAGWAWSSRVHADDLAAYSALANEIEVLDRTMTPLGHSEIPPCRDTADGLVTRTYPPSTGPQAAELVGYLGQKGWAPGPAAPPTFAHLTRTESGHLLTIDVVAPTESSLVESLTARSPASGFGCLLR